MITDMFMFFCILSVFLFGFSLGLTKIYYRVHNESELGNINNTILILFFALFGEFDLDKFQVETYPQIETFGIMIFIIYLIIAVIILINLFIAILSNTYSLIQADSDTEWKYSRALLIMTYSLYSPIPPPFNIISNIIKCLIPKKYKVDICYEIKDENEHHSTSLVIERYLKKNNNHIVDQYDIDNLSIKINKLSFDIELLSEYIYEYNSNLSPSKYDQIYNILQNS